jgi:hypothetical protein
VNGGTLLLASTGSLAGSSSLNVVSGATLQLDHSLSLADSITLTLVSGATLNLNFSAGFEQIGALVLNGTSAPAGTYDAATLTALDGTITFTGTGSLTVVPEPSVIALLAMGLGVWLVRIRRSAGRIRSSQA